MGKFMDAIKAYEQQQFFGKLLGKDKNLELGKALAEGLKEGMDTRYNEPKGKHKATEEQIDKAIEETEIYKRAKEHILKAQRGQIGYGLDKYPETLNANTWTMIESIDHIIDESVDKLHYLVMLRIQLERQAEKELADFRKMEDRRAVLNNATTRTFNFKNKRQADQFERIFNKYYEDTNLYADGQKIATFKTIKDTEEFRKEWEEIHADVDSMYPGMINMKDLGVDKAYAEVDLPDHGVCNLGHLVSVAPEHSMMHGYSMKDVEATVNLWKNNINGNLDDKYDTLANALQFGGADFDGDTVLKVTEPGLKVAEGTNITININMAPDAKAKDIAKEIRKALRKAGM